MPMCGAELEVIFAPNSLPHLHQKILFYSTSHTKDKMKQSYASRIQITKGRTALYLARSNHPPTSVDHLFSKTLDVLRFGKTA